MAENVAETVAETENKEEEIRQDIQKKDKTTDKRMPTAKNSMSRKRHEKKKEVGNEAVVGKKLSWIEIY